MLNVIGGVLAACRLRHLSVVTELQTAAGWVVLLSLLFADRGTCHLARYVYQNGVTMCRHVPAVRAGEGGRGPQH